MNCLVLYTDQMVKQKQSDLLREAEYDRLVKVITQPMLKHPQKLAAVLRRAMVGLTGNLPRLKPAEWKAKTENTRS
jgi:hypothetical protein